MNKNDFAFGKTNFLICAASVAVIILGFLLMTGPSSTIENGFEPDIFSTRRIVIAPMMCFFGFLLMIVGIVYPKKQKEITVTEETV